ncbi:MAG: M23 family metallopeptidase [Saprospiraceae bacterium]|nr:M23 family metallopeptidase [Saprospiraceae bacterium]
MEVVPEIFKPNNDHEAYRHGLTKAGLGETGLVKDWLRAADNSLLQTQKLNLPYQEIFYISSVRPEAHGYTFSAKRGQTITIDVHPENTDTLRMFIDLFRYDAEKPSRDYEQVASAEKNEYQLHFEVKQDTSYVLRIQPELLRGGSFKLSISAIPSLRFPVQDKDKRAVGSFFGDPRDGGRREHHGIDIFARRHTPILAPTDGYIRFAGERGLGGQVIWMMDRQRNLTLYFAHLETILAKQDTWVSLGDTLGTVGNTGNARTTPPHLHFGIYQNGPIDPYYFVSDPGQNPRLIRSDTALVGKQVRLMKNSFLQSPKGEKEALEQYQLFEVKAAMASEYRVALPDGRIGTVPMKDIEVMNTSISTDRLPAKASLLEHHGNRLVTIENLESTKDLTVLAKNSHLWYVKTADGKKGWIASAQ